MNGFRFGRTVEVHRSPGRQKFGDVTRVKHHEIENCGIAPRYSTDATEGNSSRVIVGFSFYGPHGADVLADDRIITPWDGNAYDVEGEVCEWISPFSGWSPGVEAALRRVT